MANPNVNYQPGVGGTPYGIDQTFPTGSPIEADSAGTATATDYLKRDLSTLVETGPKMYDEAATIAFGKSLITIPNRVTEWFEHGWQFGPVVVNANVGATAASAGNFVTQSVVVTAGTIRNLGKDTAVTYPDGTKGVVTAINYGTNTLTITSARSSGLPALTASDELVPGLGTVLGDRRNYIPNFNRPTFGTRYNYLTRIEDAVEWGRHELAEWKAAQNFGVVEQSMKNLNKNIRFNAMAHLMNGTRGKYQISGGEETTMMGGIYPFSVAAGAVNQDVDISTLQSVFEQTAMNTNFNAEGSRRPIMGRHGVLLELSKLYKSQITRVTWETTVAKLDLEAIQFGGAIYPLVPAEWFTGGTALLESGTWGNMLALIDWDSVQMCQQQGMPFYMDNDPIKGLTQGDGSLQDSLRYRVEMNFTARFPEPRRNAFLKVTGI